MIDFVRLAEDFRIDYAESGHHHCHDGWIQTHCPFCTDGTSGFHLGFSKTRGNFSCWRCGGLRFWEVLCALLKVSEGECRSIIPAYIVNTVGHTPQETHRSRSIRLPEFAKPMRRQHRDYLRSRGFDPHQLSRVWGLLGAGPAAGVWAWRIIIPIYGVDGKLLAYQGRAIVDDVKPKYRMLDDEDCAVSPSRLLYGMTKVRGLDSVIVVEGVTDVWRIGPGAVCTFGIAWKAEQLHPLRHFKRRFVLFDPEHHAQLRAESLAKQLSAFGGQTEIISGFSTDPGEFTSKQVRRLREELDIRPSLS